MKKVFAIGGRAVLVEVPEPVLRPGEVLVAPAFSAISAGTETSVIKMSADPVHIHDHDYPGPVPYGPKLRSSATTWGGLEPRTSIEGHALIGYSLAGIVMAVSPEVTDLRPGDRVACSGSQCSHHADLVAVPRNLCTPVPDGVGLDDAAFVTLGTIALESVRLTRAHFGETIVSYGVGLLGLLATQIAISGGIYVVGLDVSEPRLEMARQFGAIATANPLDGNAKEVVFAATDGFGADGVILATLTDSSEPLNDAMRMVRQRGVVVGLGAFGTTFDRDAMVWNDVQLVMQLAYGPGRYDQVYEEGNVDYPIGLSRWTENRNSQHFLRLLAERKVSVAGLAPDRVPFARATDAYDLLLAPDRPATVLFDYGKA